MKQKTIVIIVVVVLVLLGTAWYVQKNVLND